MMISKITTHIQDALGRLLEQYKGNVRFEGLLTSIVQEAQNIENMMFDLKDNKTLQNAVGATLDRFGLFVGVERLLGESDFDYRSRIETATFTNRSQATQQILIDVVLLFTAATFVLVLDGSTASIAIQFNDDTLTSDQKQVLYDALTQTKAAGVRIEYIGSYEDISTVFAFEGSEGLGFGDSTDPSTGGGFASVDINGL